MFLYDQVLADVRSTGAGIKCPNCSSQWQRLRPRGHQGMPTTQKPSDSSFTQSYIINAITRYKINAYLISFDSRDEISRRTIKLAFIPHQSLPEPSSITYSLAVCRR